MRKSMDSRLRGNDGANAVDVIPAQAGIHAASTEHERFRPQPRSSGGPVRPGLLRRLAALVYDALLLFAVLFAATVPVLIVTGGQAVGPNDPAYTAWLLAASYLYFGWCWTRSGQTLGMRAWRIRVRTRDGARLGWRHALARFAAGLVSIGAAGAGLLWVAFDRDALSLHDRLSGTALEVVSREGGSRSAVPAEPEVR